MLIAVEWPSVSLDYYGAMFYHDHALGSGFWVSLVMYFVCNSLGWFLFVYMGGLAISILRKTRHRQGEDPETEAL
jgi:hypothetical protein